MDRPSNKCEAQGRLGVVAGEGKSLIHRSDRRTLDVDHVQQRRVKIHLGNIGENGQVIIDSIRPLTKRSRSCIALIVVQIWLRHGR